MRSLIHKRRNLESTPPLNSCAYDAPTDAPTIQYMLAATAKKFRMNAGAGGRNRTGTGVTPRDFESTRDLSTGAACRPKIGAWYLRFSAAFSLRAEFDAPMI